jgi:plastocyanin
MWYCTDDFGQNSDYACSIDNEHYKEGGRPNMEYCDYGHEDDDASILDGIVGINNPKDNEPMPMSENIIGALSDNEGLPLMRGTSFKVNFDGVDESLDSHELYMPIGDQEDDTIWYVEMILLEGYEVISCEGCEDLVIDGNNAKFNANEPVTVIFGSRPVVEEDTSECDVIVTIGDDGYSFDSADITIAAGDTVCWMWKDTTDAHNVAEIATKFDADMNLEDAKIGFYSGEAANSVDFRHTFSEDNQTHYYVCEPHATMGMAGTVTVGAGSEGDRIPEVLEDSGLPNVSFMVGALVLVGAASLRRRIH